MFPSVKLELTQSSCHVCRYPRVPDVSDASGSYCTDLLLTYKGRLFPYEGVNGVGLGHTCMVENTTSTNSIFAHPRRNWSNLPGFPHMYYLLVVSQKVTKTSCRDSVGQYTHTHNYCCDHSPFCMLF